MRRHDATELAWATSEQVSSKGEQVLDDGDLLKVLVEKDFTGRTGREGVDGSDMCEHPEAGKASC